MSLNLPRLLSPRFTAIDPATGRPVSFGSVAVYVAGTTVLAQIYTNREATGIASNPAPLDAAGSAVIFISGPVRIEVKDANGVLIYSDDHINAEEIEIGGDAPDGALLAANNLADLVDVATARAALGLQKQAGVADATAGRVLLVGGLGYGGNAVSVPGQFPATDFNDLIQPGRFTIDAPASLANQPPTNASGLLLVDRRTASRVFQEFVDVGAGLGGSGRRHSRVLTGGGWSRWVTSYDHTTAVGTVSEDGGLPTGALMQRISNSNGHAIRLANGYQKCWRGNATFTYLSPAALTFTWTYPAQFASPGGAPVIGEVHLPTGEENYVGVGFIEVGNEAAGEGLASATFSLRRAYGAPDFAPGARVLNCKLSAEGWWF